MTSKSDTETRSPSPVAPRRSNAASVPIAAYEPAPISATGIEMRAGSLGSSGHGDQPGLALNDEVVGVLRRVRAVRPVAGDLRVDDVRSQPANGLLVQAHAAGPTGSEVDEEHVGPLDQAIESGPRLRALEVERDAPLAPVDPHEPG